MTSNYSLDFFFFTFHHVSFWGKWPFSSMVRKSLRYTTWKTKQAVQVMSWSSKNECVFIWIPLYPMLVWIGMHFVSRPPASHVLLQCKNLNFKCSIVIDEQYSWMQGFPLKLPYNCHEYMQIDLSGNHRSDVFQGNLNTKCHQMVLSSSFSMHNSGSWLSAIKGKWAPFGPGGTYRKW